MENNSKSGAQIICETLIDLNILNIFGYIGGTIIPFYDALTKYPNLKHIMVRHEQAAAFAAQGYARASGQMSACVSCSGPGAMNLTTGIADAMMDSVPLLAITGQVNSKAIGTDAFQESDVIGVMLPITKANKMNLNIDQLSLDIKNLASIASSGRMGPVHIDIPKDIQSSKTIFNVEDVIPTYIEPKVEIDMSLVNQATHMVSSSQKPIILIGHGVILSGANNEVKDLISYLNIPFSSTIHGLSAIVDKYPIDHKLNLGMMGMHGTVAANLAIKNADLIIALGMRFDDRVTGNLKTYAKDANVIHVDIDNSEIDKNVLTNIGINGDLKEVVKLLTQNSNRVNNHNDWVDACYEHQKEWELIEHDFLQKGVGKNGKILMSYAIHTLSVITKGNDNIVSDVGQHQMFAARYYEHKRYNSWFCSGGSGTMGFAIPTSIGVQVARPNERVWCICGDGGFQMNSQELITISTNNLPIKIIILNNEYLGMVRQWQDLFHDGNHSSTYLQNPDFQLLAKANNIQSAKVTDKDDLAQAIQIAADHNGPYLLEIMTDIEEFIYPMIASGADISEIKIK